MDHIYILIISNYIMPAKELNLSGSTKNKTQNQSTWKNFNWRICNLFLEDINFLFFMVRKDDQVNNLCVFFFSVWERNNLVSNSVCVIHGKRRETRLFHKVKCVLVLKLKKLYGFCIDAPADLK